METLKIIFPTIIIILLGFLIYRQIGLEKGYMAEIEYWKQKDFKTDTVRESHYYTLPSAPTPQQGDKSNPIVIPPKEVITYLPPSSQDILRIADSILLILDSMNNEKYRIAREYYLQSPKANKLLQANLKKDTLKFDFLKTDGKTYTEVYPLNLESYRYTFLNNSMHATEIQARNTPLVAKNKLFKFNGVYIYGVHDFINKSPAIETNIGFNLGKVRVLGFGTINFGNSYTNNPTSAGIKIGYEIF